MGRDWIVTATVLLAPWWLLAQSPRFDVASVKVHQPNSPDRPQFGVSANHLKISGNINQLVIYAYDLKRYQVSGGPDWVVNPSLDRDYYDIDAAAEEGRILTTDEARLMLRTLLAERFLLAVHKESRSMPVYALVVNRGGPKLKESSADEVTKSSGHAGATTVTFAFVRSTIDSLVQLLSGAAERPVVDRTGLSGNYDFKVEFARNPTAAIADDVPIMFTAVQELGLKLESQKAPVEMMVIDRVERPFRN